MKNFFKNMKKYNKYAIRAAKSELKSEVADSYLNWLWWIIEPFCFMLIYTFVFGYVFHNTQQYFASFVMVGQALWQFFERMVKGSVNLIISNRDLVTKVYLPKYILLYSKSLTYLFKFAISMGLAVGLMIFQHVPITIYFLYIIPVLIVLYLLSFGIGLILMHFGVTLNDLANLTNIALRMVFYLSGIFYNIRARLHGTLGYLLLRLNPAAFLMDEARKAMIWGPKYHLGLKVLCVWCLVAVLLCIIGINLIHKNENSYAKVI